MERDLLVYFDSSLMKTPENRWSSSDSLCFQLLGVILPARLDISWALRGGLKDKFSWF